MAVHTLKTWPPFYRAVEDGSKRFEYRINDRPYEVGDILELKEWDDMKEVFTGRCSRWEVTYMIVIHSDGGCAPDETSVIMSISREKE